jgi:hypothetical protein
LRILLFLALQVLQLVGFTGPLFSVGQPPFHFGNARPYLGQLSVQFQKYSLVLWQLILGEYGIHGALWLTQGAIDTFVRVNNQKIGALVKAINRADLNTVGVLTVDAILSYNKCHS